MADTRRWESFKAEGDQIVERLRKLVHEGNVRRIVANTMAGRSRSFR
jgi:hypothetical protein